jgi:hypothetical protein
MEQAEANQSWVTRFVCNARNPANSRESGELSATELADAESEIIRETQHEDFAAECKTLLREKQVHRKAN